MSFDVDGAEGARWTEVLAGAAADAALLVYDGNLRRVGLRGVGGNHRDGLGRTVAGAVAARNPVGERYAVLPHPDGVADLDGRLVGYGDRLDRPGGTHLRALDAFGPAIAPFVGGFGLHEGHDARRGAQHAVGADRHAELASRAVLGQVAQALGSRRHDRRVACGGLLVEDHGQAAVHLLLLGADEARAQHQSRTREERTARSVLRHVPLRGCRRSLFGVAFAGQAEPVVERVVLAAVHAVHADHAARIVDRMVFRIDAGGLALSRAESAGGALRRVDHRAEEREAREKSQDSAHGAYGIAPGAAVAPGQNDEQDERRRGDEQRRQAAHPHLRTVEGVAVGPFGQVGQQVVAPAVEGGQQILRDAAIGAVGRYQCHERSDTGNECRDEEDEDAVAQPSFFGRVGVAVLPLAAPAAKPRDDVLHDSERADDRAVDAPEEQREEHEGHHDAQMQGQQRRQELDLRQPPEPRVQAPRKVEEEQRDKCEAEDRKRCSDLS